jgi:hypothetical protein
MPRICVAVCTRPDFEVATYIGKLGLQHAVDYWRGKGYEIGDLVGDNAVRDKVLSELSSRDPIFFFGVGHGNPSVFTGQNYNRIFWTCNCKELSGRVVYLLSCSTGAGLGPDIVNKKARCYIGYKEDFVWVQEKLQDPLNDKYARGFYEAVLEILYKLADGYTAGQANAASIDKWNYWIDYWSRSPDPHASEVVMWLKHDRDAQVLIGDPNATVAPGGAPAPIPFLVLGLAPLVAIGAVVGYNEHLKGLRV